MFAGGTIALVGSKAGIVGFREFDGLVEDGEVIDKAEAAVPRGTTAGVMEHMLFEMRCWC